MKHLLAIVIAALALAAAATPAQAQSTFTIPFKFESGAKKFPAGDYLVTKTGDAEVTFKQLSTGREVVLPVTQKLEPTTARPTPPPAGPALVFDEVGNFEPSYTEYFTVYVLAEVWLTRGEGYLIHMTKGAHKTKIVNGDGKRN